MRLPGLTARSTLIHLARRLPLLLAVLGLIACAPLPGPDRAGTFPLLEDGNARPGVKRAIVAIPGAFASANIFAPVLDWKVPDSTVIVYRFPDMDGLPLDHRVQIDGSAQLIADYVNDLGAQEVYLLGYSTGGPIAIETAQRIEGAGGLAGPDLHRRAGAGRHPVVHAIRGRGGARHAAHGIPAPA